MTKPIEIDDAPRLAKLSASCNRDSEGRAEPGIGFTFGVLQFRLALDRHEAMMLINALTGFVRQDLELKCSIRGVVMPREKLRRGAYVVLDGETLGAEKWGTP